MLTLNVKLTVLITFYYNIRKILFIYFTILKLKIKQNKILATTTTIITHYNTKYTVCICEKLKKYPLIVCVYRYSTLMTNFNNIHSST